MADVDIGTLAGKVALEDKTSATVDLILSKVTALENRFNDGLNPSVVKAAEGFAIAEGAIRLFDKAVETAVDVVKDLTVEGSKIGHIEDNFEHLTSSASRLGSTLLGELRAGTHGTITDLELIKVANHDLTVGVDLTDQQFRSMANGAFALAHAKGLDVKNTLDLLNESVTTGNARSLRALGIRIDQSAAEDEFAAKMDTTADRLNEEGKAQAGRIAILDAVSKATGRLGDQTDGLDDVIGQIETKWHNFYEQLSKAIGTSPAVVHAVEAIGDSLTKAFGGDSQHMVESVAGWVNYLADKVAQYAPVVIDGFIKIKTWVSNTIAEVRAGWDTLPDWLKATAADSLIAGAAFLTMNTGVKAVSGGSFDLIGTLGNLTTTLSGIPTAFANIASGAKLLGGLTTLVDINSISAARASVNLLGKSISDMITPLGAVGLATAAVFAAYEIGKTKPVSDFFEGIGLRLHGLSKAQADAAITLGHQLDAQQKAGAASKAQADAIAQTKAIMDAFTKSTHESSAATDHNTGVQDKNKFIVNQTREELKKMADARKALASVDEDWHKTVDALDQTMVKSIMHYLEAGVSQDKLATFYHLTAEQIAAVAKALTDQTQAEKISEKAATDAEKRWSDLAGLRESMSGKTTDIMIADEQRWVAAEIKAHVDAKTDTADFYNWLHQMDRTRTEAAVQSRLKDNTNSKAYWDDQKAQAEDAYQFALEHSDQFTGGYIEGLRQTRDEARAAARDWKENAGTALDELTEKARKLKEALDAGFSFDVSATNLENTLNGMRTSTGGNMGVYYQYAQELAKKGYSFQEILGILEHPTGSLPSPQGPKIPGFRDGGVGDFGDGTIAELHGKEAIIPLDGNHGLGPKFYNTFYVNGTGRQVARDVGEIWMDQARTRRMFGAA